MPNSCLKLPSLAEEVAWLPHNSLQINETQTSSITWIIEEGSQQRGFLSCEPSHGQNLTSGIQRMKVPLLSFTDSCQSWSRGEAMVELLLICLGIGLVRIWPMVMRNGLMLSRAGSMKRVCLHMEINRQTIFLLSAIILK